MTKPQQTDALLRLLAALQQALGRLLALLEQEQLALRDKNIDSMEKIAADKEAISAEVEQLEQQRQQLCEQFKIAPDHGGLTQFLHGIPALVARRVQERWQAISEIGAACLEQNQVNGIVVAHQQRHTQDALAILRGAVTSSELYSAKGARSMHGSQHSLGRV